MRKFLTLVILWVACGMSTHANARMIFQDGRKFLDRSNVRYGRLVADRLAYFNSRDQAYWHCRCDCGNSATVFGGNLTSGQSRSCGCMALEGNNFRHGQAKTRAHTKEYDCWVSMKSRVLNPKNKRFMSYGGRGIHICERWLESFENFFADMGAKPSAKHTIHRVDNNGNYEPKNCIWATKEQWWARSDSRMLEFRGQTKCVAEWAEVLSTSARNIYNRLKLGWTTERALTQPVRRQTKC